MTPPTGYYAYGPPVLEEAPDIPPLTIRRRAINHERTGEAVFIVDAIDREPQVPMTLLLAANPHTGEIVRVAVNLQRGVGFVAADVAGVPGNLRDIIKTILLEAHESA